MLQASLRGTLRRSFGGWELLLFGIGVVIGPNVYSGNGTTGWCERAAAGLGCALPRAGARSWRSTVVVLHCAPTVLPAGCARSCCKARLEALQHSPRAVVVVGVAGRRYAVGPALFLSYAIAGFSALCAAAIYGEFVMEYPISGGGFTYTMLTFGELPAWMTLTALILSYVVGMAGVSAPRALCAAVHMGDRLPCLLLSRAL